MSDLAQRRLITQSGTTRAVTKLERQGFVVRVADDEDGRSSLAVLTKRGLRKLRAAQVTHHQVVRALYLDKLTSADHRRLAALFERAHPGAGTDPVWPPPPAGG
jgi:DNA-binding MarR family transcriptional regulator